MINTFYLTFNELKESSPSLLNKKIDEIILYHYKHGDYSHIKEVKNFDDALEHLLIREDIENDIDSCFPIKIKI